MKLKKMLALTMAAVLAAGLTIYMRKRKES